MVDRVEPSDVGGPGLDADSEPTVHGRGPESNVLGKGDVLGRYMVLGLAGRGGMGRVYRAYDPKLKREVALKVLRTNDLEHEQRAVREAQAMAALSHPNVVPVYDVDRTQGRIYIAMEFIAGRTLDAWLGPHPGQRSTADILDVMIEVGRGLAAAHRAELVHRDLKPANIVVGDDGRTRVMDFGLARGSGVDTETSGGSTDPLDASGPLTRRGMVMGTPSYMPPEQHRAGLIDARSDQYAYCVVFYEALFGERPFRAHELEELTRLKERGLPEWSPSPELPPSLVHALRKGLAPRPANRHSSMDALLAEIDRDRGTVSRRASSVIVAAGLTALGLGGLAWQSPWDARSPDPCAGTAKAVLEVWNPSSRSAVAERLSSTDVPFAADTTERLTARLDQYARELTNGRHAACAATLVHHEQSEALMDQRFACLDRAASSLATTVETLDATVIHDGMKLVLGLPELSRCSDTAAMLTAFPRPDDPEASATLARLEARLENARVLRRAGRHTEALADAEALLRDTEHFSFPPLEAEVLYMMGRLRAKSGDYEQSRDTLQRAYHAAIKANHDELAASASSELTYVVGALLQNHERGQLHAEDSRAWSDKVGTERAHAQHHKNYAMLLQQMGRYKDAQQRFTRVLDIRQRTSEPDSIPVANALTNLGAVLMDQELPGEAAELFARSAAIIERIFGPDHVANAAFINNLANARSRQGQLDEAWSQYERVHSLLIRTYGNEHPDVAGVQLNMATLARGRGDAGQATELFASTLSIQRSVLAPNNPRIAQTLTAYGTLELERGNLDRAAELLDEALTINEVAYTTDHPQIATSLELAAVVDIERKAWDQAVARLERSSAVRANTESSQRKRSHGEYYLALALWGQGSHERAIASARAARRHAAESDTAFRASLDAWLAEHADHHPNAQP